MIDTLGLIFISIGLGLDIIGCLGLIRLPDVYNRLQAGVKCVTIGTSSILLGVLLIEGFNSIGMKILVCTVFLIFTAPVTAHALLRGSHRYGVKLWSGSIVDQYKSDRQNTKE